MKIYYVECWYEHALIPTYEFFKKEEDAESFVKVLKEKYGYARPATVIHEAELHE